MTEFISARHITSRKPNYACNELTHEQVKRINPPESNTAGGLYFARNIRTRDSTCSGSSSIYVETGAPDIYHLTTLSSSSEDIDHNMLCSNSEESSKVADQKTSTPPYSCEHEVLFEGIEPNEMFSVEVPHNDNSIAGIEVVSTITFSENFTDNRVNKVDHEHLQPFGQNNDYQNLGRYQRPRDSLLVRSDKVGVGEERMVSPSYIRKKNCKKSDEHYTFSSKKPSTRRGKNWSNAAHHRDHKSDTNTLNEISPDFDMQGGPEINRHTLQLHECINESRLNGINVKEKYRNENFDPSKTFVRGYRRQKGPSSKLLFRELPNIIHGKSNLPPSYGYNKDLNAEDRTNEKSKKSLNAKYRSN